MRSRLLARAAPLAVLALVFVIVPERSMPRSFDYLDIEAGSGASSGGHAAIRFGDDTYHFLNADPGIVRAVRVRSDAFDYVYRAYDNRGIDVTRVDVSDATYAALRAAFVRRLLVEDAQLDALDSARHDGMLLDWLAANASRATSPGLSADPGIRLRGTGYFYGGSNYDTPTAGVATSKWAAVLVHTGAVTIRAVREEIERELGAGWIDRQVARLDREIHSLRYTCAKAPTFERNRVPDAGAEFADRYRDLLLARLALYVIATARPPVPEGFRTSPRQSFILDTREIQAMRTRSTQLRARLQKLVTSSRRDRGFPILVALARLVAMDTSVELGRLVVPDTFEDDHDTITPELLLTNENAATVVLAEKQDEFARAKRAAENDASDNEVTWTRLELAANLYLEFERGFMSGALIRVEPSPVPSRAAALDPAWPHPDAAPAALAAWRDCARAVTDDIQAELEQLYGYDLVSRNCVTEIFATIDSAFAQTPPSAAPEIAERAALGGRVDGERGLNFIPFFSAAAVNHTYRVAERSRLPSYRHYWLDRMLRDNDSITTRLRESNTLTSRLYQHGESDIFLFFTDDAPALRPIFGATNVIFGTGAAAAGLLTSPFDHGRLALGGLRGVLFSIPELAFVNIRKGSNVIVPRNWMNTPGFDATYTTAQRDDRYSQTKTSDSITP